MLHSFVQQHLQIACFEESLTSLVLLQLELIQWPMEFPTGDSSTCVEGKLV